MESDVVDSLLLHAESGPNDHWKDAPLFRMTYCVWHNFDSMKILYQISQMTPSLNIKQGYAIRFEMVQEGYVVSSHPFFLLEPFYPLTYCPHTLELETE